MHGCHFRCGISVPTARGQCRPLWVTRARCAVSTWRATDWSAALRTRPSRL